RSPVGPRHSEPGGGTEDQVEVEPPGQAAPMPKGPREKGPREKGPTVRGPRAPKKSEPEPVDVGVVRRIGGTRTAGTADEEPPDAKPPKDEASATIRPFHPRGLADRVRRRGDPPEQPDGPEGA